jgi:hypothetical protein
LSRSSESASGVARHFVAIDIVVVVVVIADVDERARDVILGHVVGLRVRLSSYCTAGAAATASLNRLACDCISSMSTRPSSRNNASNERNRVSIA